MRKKYYGIYNGQVNENSEMSEMLNFFLKNNLLSKTISCINYNKEKTLEKNGFKKTINLNSENIKYVFSDEVTNEVYSYFKNKMLRSINANLLLFEDEFENSIYGYSEKKKRKRALKEFNQLFDEIFHIIFDNSQIILGSKKFPKIQLVKQNLLNKLKEETEIIVNFLCGNDLFFTRNLLDTNQFLLKMFDFENNLAKIIALNKRFQFEDDDIFTPKSIAKLIYEEYSYEFHSLKQVEFIEKHLFNEENKNYSFVVSLFYFFSDEIKIKTPPADLFKEIITNNFDFTFSKIKLNVPSNSKHKKRITLLKEQWLNS